MGDLPVRASIESTDELDDITASVASSETPPEVLATRDDESSWIVASVDGAWAVEIMSLSAHSCQQASMFEDLLDGDESLEATEAQVGRDHVVAGVEFPVSVSAFPAGKGNGKLMTRRLDSRARS